MIRKIKIFCENTKAHRKRGARRFIKSFAQESLRAEDGAPVYGDRWYEVDRKNSEVSSGVLIKDGKELQLDEPQPDGIARLLNLGGSRSGRYHTSQHLKCDQCDHGIYIRHQTLTGILGRAVETGVEELPLQAIVHGVTRQQ